MFLYIDNKPLWAKIISDALDEGMKNLGGQACMFHMTSYVVYSCTYKGTFDALTTMGKVGGDVDDAHIWDHYPQLQRKNYLLDYKLVNDAFSMHLVRTMEEDRTKRLSMEAQKVIYRHGTWFI